MHRFATAGRTLVVATSNAASEGACTRTYCTAGNTKRWGSHATAAASSVHRPSAGDSTCRSRERRRGAIGKTTAAASAAAAAIAAPTSLRRPLASSSSAVGARITWW